MASSNQSAKQYLKDAVKNLVGKLKNLPLIFEKLQQWKVFSDNEINQIETETTSLKKTRKILDLVLNKGEEACYQFLRILDRERKSVLPDPNSSSQAPDLHTWICMFSFRDEAKDYIQGPISCHQLQHFMKKISRQILAEHWKKSLQLYGENIQENVTFIPLVLDTNTEKNTPYNKIKLKSKKFKKTRSKKMKAYIPRDTQGKSPEELLNSREKNILIVGKPGIGKTTVVKQMLHHWAERNDRNLDFMFYFDENTLSSTSAAVTLEELLLSTFFMSKPQLKKNAEEIMQYLQEYSEKVTIVFDGINGDFQDNTVFLKIMENELLPEAKIVATCRSEVEYEFSDWPTCTIYVQGFSEESIYDFFNKMTDDPDLVDNVINNPALFSLCHIPMYAFMVAACTLNNTSKEAQTLCTASKMYMWIFSHCLKKLHGLGGYNKNYRDMVLSLAESAFNATKLKTINLELDYDENVIAHTFLKTATDAPAFDRHFCAFSHNTMQEFFSALWLLEKTEILDEVLQLCQNEKTQHMKYVIPFLCGLHGNRGIVDSWKSIPHLEGLFSLNKVKENTNAFFEKVLNTFFCDQADDVDIAFICQCLYEFQSPEFCCSFLERIDYCLDFSEEHLDPYTCCAVSYVISNSRNKQVYLNLEKSAVSLSELKTILKCSQYLRHFSTTLCQVWTMALKYENMVYLIHLFQLCGYEIHILMSSPTDVLEQVGKIITQNSEKINLHLHCDQDPRQLTHLVYKVFSWLPHISALHFNPVHGIKEHEKRCRIFQLDLCLQAALQQPLKIQETMQRIMQNKEEQSDLLLDLYFYVKQYESITGSSVLPALLPIYQSIPAVWSINLSERKVSLLLEVLKFQTQKKPVELRDYSEEESEVRSFLHCLPYISHLRFNVFDRTHGEKEHEKRCRTFRLNLCLQAALHQPQNILETVQKMMPNKEEQSDFLLDLYFHVKQYESETGSSVLPAFLSVYQSVSVWSIKLSERKDSLLLEVLKLQTQKKPVELRDCTDEESEVRSFLRCLPYISQLSVNVFDRTHGEKEHEKRCRTFRLDLCLQAALHQPQNILETVQKIMPNKEEQSDFLLDLYFHVKQYESETASSVLPAFLSVYQSVSVWSIKLSERKVSLLLEVLKLQTQKKPVELRDYTEEQSEMYSFLQCLSYISELRCNVFHSVSASIKFLLNLIIAAFNCQLSTGERYPGLLASVCSYNTFPFGVESHELQERQSDFLLDLYSHVTSSYSSVLIALLPLYQSIPAVWSIKLTERKVSLLLEVLKLQTQKKPVVLRDYTEEESEVRSFLQCLPYISELRFESKHGTEEQNKRFRKFTLDLCLQAALHQPQNIQETVKKVMTNEYNNTEQSDFLLNLYSHVKQYESESGSSVLPALLPVYQSVSVWTIKLSERKVSLLLEVLKLQTQKKPVYLRDCTDEESEVRSFLQCLPYISQLRFNQFESKHGTEEQNKRFRKFTLDLCLQAALHQPQNIQETVKKVMTNEYNNTEESDLLLDLYSHVKQYESETGSSVLPALLPVYQSVSYWFINLSEIKASLLQEVLKLQTQKKPVYLRDCTDEESEVRSFLQCLPYISHLRFNQFESKHGTEEQNKRFRKFTLDLCLQAALHQPQNIQETVKKVMTNKYNNTEESDFLLDLYSHVKQDESEKRRSVLPALLPVYQSVLVWTIKLSERKVSLLLEVLKLQTQKKPVYLRDCTEEESEVRSFLQCLPYISQLRFNQFNSDSASIRFLLNLSVAAVDCQSDKGENFTELLASVCSYNTFPFDGECYRFQEEQSDFLLDLYSHVMQYERETGSSVLPAFLPVYQSGPNVWSINLSERNISLLLEVLKLQTQKKPVELRDCTDEESEVRSFLQCLPYISQLRFNSDSASIRFLLNLSVAAVDCQSDKGENFTELLASVCSYNTFPFDRVSDEFQEEQTDFLLDLYSHVMQYERETGSSVLPAFLPVYQSGPDVWSINLSERNISLLLEVLKLQTQKKPVELRDCTDEESEVRSFLQCLPYISQLRFNHQFNSDSASIRFLLNLSVAAVDCQSDKGENFTELLASVCSYNTFPFDGECYRFQEEQSDFLLDLYSHVMQYERETGSSVLPAFLPVYQSVPDVWSINLSERNISLLLEVLKLQTQKKPVELRDCTAEESEVRSFLQCLPYISQLRFNSDSASIRFLLNLSIAAVDCQSDKGENFTELLASVCSYNTFPFGVESHRFQEVQSDFLLDLYSHVMQYERETGSSVLPAFLPVYQSVPDVWFIKLSERKVSLLLEVLKLQTQKKPVELRDCTDEESEVRSFLQCLPYISQLRCDKFIPRLSKAVVENAEDTELVRAFFAATDSIFIIDWVLSTRECRAVRKVLKRSDSNLKLTLTPRGISLRGLRLLFRYITHLQKLCLSGHVVQRMVQAFRAVRSGASVVIDELCMDLNSITPNKTITYLSSLCSLLNIWTVHCVNLSECRIDVHSLISLMCHPGHLKIRLSKETLQQFTDLLCEVRDGELTRFFLEKTGGDLTSCSLSWEELINFLQQRVCRINVNIRKSKIEHNHVRQILPLLSEVQFKRLNPRVLLSVIREIYETRSADCVSGLLSSTHSCINLSNTELDSYHSTALHFTLQHSTSVCLNLLWTSIQEEDLMKILPLFNKVSQLSVDRVLLLKLLYCCSNSEFQRGAATAVFSALKNRLDFSCSTGLDLTTETQDNVLPLTTEDCRDISTAIQNSHQLTELILKECQIEDAALDLFFPILHTVRLRCSKPLLLQFLALLRVVNESECVRHVRSLSQALDEEMDLSETPLDLHACRSLALFLEFTEGLSELDLSHCKLSEHGLELLLPHLHKTAVLDLSHNAIDDNLAGRIYTIVSTNSNIQTVRLFNNRITDKKHFQKDKRFEIW